MDNYNIIALALAKTPITLLVLILVDDLDNARHINCSTGIWGIWKQPLEGLGLCNKIMNVLCTIIIPGVTIKPTVDPPEVDEDGVTLRCSVTPGTDRIVWKRQDDGPLPPNRHQISGAFDEVLRLAISNYT